MPVKPEACPCGSGETLSACCGPFLAGAPALDAEALMRSRYTAYTLGNADYLLATWHPSTRPADLDLSDHAGLRWLGLDVRRYARQDEDHATVEFVARMKSAGRAARLHEVSRFVREDGRWYYVDGEMR